VDQGAGEAAPTAALGVEELLAALSLEEKARLVEGSEWWQTFAIERLGIPAIYLTDGPHGVRRVRGADGAFGIADNLPATAFPTAATAANSWDPEGLRRMGAAIGHEAVDLGVDVLLAPGVNIKRSPLCGRNFEYYSEDPLLAGELGAGFVRGVQEQGVAASVKHFAANSNEDFRFVGDSLVDERAQREIYLRQFERIVRTARPATVMCAYNAVNGTFCSEHRELLTGILREEWGFEGLVVTDWGAMHDRVVAVRAGCDLEMPGDNRHSRRELVAAVRDGRLSAGTLDTAVRRVLGLIERSVRAERPASAHDPAAHAALARDLAVDSAVLLANDGALPLDAGAELVVIGEMFERMRYQGAGSSLVNPTELVSPRDAFDARGVRYRYARGYRGSYAERDEGLEREALAAARSGATVLFFGGLGDLEESEGFDRSTMAMAPSQTALLEAILDTGARVVLVLFGGAPVELPFLDRLAAVLDLYLPGMLGGEAAARLLLGEATPSGKLAESWPLTAADSSAAADFDRGVVARYAESIYVGYRYYDAAGTVLRFPFGHGLSYTRFAYRDLSVEVRDGRVLARATIENVGDRDGVEIVQLYVRNPRGAVFKAEKELRAFARVAVPAGAAEPVELGFAIDDLAYWDVAEHGWVLENGEYEVLLAASAADVRLRAPLPVDSGRPSRSPYPAAVDADYRRPPVGVPASFPALLGHAVPEARHPSRLTMDTRLVDARRSLLGGLLHRGALSRASKDYRAALALPDGPERDERVKHTHFLVRMLPTLALRTLTMSSGGLPHHVALAIAEFAAWHPIRGLRLLLAGRRADRAA